MIYMINAETFDCLEPFATKLPFIGLLGKVFIAANEVAILNKLYVTDNFRRDSYTLK